MAIININANLNGGDDTTPDNELFYRIYGDVDAYASPIHTTGTAIADADVTVTGDVVDISNVDGTTNMSFKIAAVDGDGNEGILSDALSYLILSQPFAGITSPLVTDENWTVVETDPAQYSFDTNDGLVVSGTFGVTESYANTLLGKDGVSTLNCCLSFDLAMDLEAAASGWAGLFSNVSVPLANCMAVRTQADGVIDAYVREDETTLLTTGALVYDAPAAATASIQITGDGSNYKVYLWEGSWVEKQSVAFTFSDTMYFGYYGISGADTKPTGKFKNIALGTFAQRWTTQYPSSMTPY